MIGKVTPTRNDDGLVIEGEIANLGSTPRDVPRLRLALRDATEKEVQFEVVDPPRAQLQPGEVAHFSAPFAHPARCCDRRRRNLRPTLIADAQRRG